MAKNNNVSKKAPNKSASKKPNKVHVGSTLQTRDEHLLSGRGKKDIKPDHPSPTDLYRTAGVVAMNADGELAVIKLSTKGEYSLKTYRNGKSRFRPHVEIKDSKGNRIKINGITFVLNSTQRDLSKKEVEKILFDCLYNPKTKNEHRNKNKQNLNNIRKR